MHIHIVSTLHTVTIIICNDHRSIEIMAATNPDALFVAMIAVVYRLRPNAVVVGSSETSWRAALDHLVPIVC